MYLVQIAGSLGIFLALILSSPVSAKEAQSESPLTMARFEITKTRVSCPDCRPDWRVILKSAGTAMVPKDKKIVGHIIMARLDDKRLKIMTSKPIEDKSCAARSYVAEGYEEEGKKTLPVKLRTAQEWSQKLGINVAFNANFFKHAAGAEQFAKIPCGEVTGIAKSGGKLYWPPEDRTDLLAEAIANNPDHESWAVTVSNASLNIFKPLSFARLDTHRDVFAGAPLFVGYWDNPNLPDAPVARKARLGIGYVPRTKSALVLMVEGPENPDSKVVGIRTAGLSILFRAFGAVHALNLPGGSYAQVATPTGTVSKTEGHDRPLPVTNHFGFRVVEAVPK